MRADEGKNEESIVILHEHKTAEIYTYKTRIMCIRVLAGVPPIARYKYINRYCIKLKCMYE